MATSPPVATSVCSSQPSNGIPENIQIDSNGRLIMTDEFIPSQSSANLSTDVHENSVVISAPVTMVTSTSLPDAGQNIQMIQVQIKGDPDSLMDNQGSLIISDHFPPSDSQEQVFSNSVMSISQTVTESKAQSTMSPTMKVVQIQEGAVIDDTNDIIVSQSDHQPQECVTVTNNFTQSESPVHSVDSAIMTITETQSPTVSTMVQNPEIVHVVENVAHMDNSNIDTLSHTITEEGGIGGCLVCGDRASGYHYSVFSCEGCKGFFKRSVQKNLLYNCKGQGNCDINKFTRNSCQFCRFNRCMQMGMKKEAVREDRSPGGKHRNKRPRLDGMPLTPESQTLYQSVPGQAVTSASGEFHDSLVEGLVLSKPDLIPSVEGSTTADTLQSLGINELMQYGYMELKYIIDWAKKVPGFQGLPINDQMSLLKSSFMELNVVRLSYRSMDYDNAIKFAEGLVLPLEVCNSMGWGMELIGATVEFAKRMKDLQVDIIEFCIINAIILTYPDAAGITEKGKVTSLQTQILDSLRRYEAHKYPGDPRRYGKMLLRLPALRTVSSKAAEKFLSLTLEGNIQLNDLVMEMIDMK